MYAWPMFVLNEIIQGVRASWTKMASPGGERQANSTSLPPNPKVNKAEKETYLSKHCAYNFA
jgi:hypothetical protein